MNISTLRINKFLEFCGIILTLSLCAFNAIAADARIDISSMYQTRLETGQYYVIFSTRSSAGLGPGHVYVTWTHEAPENNRTEFEAYGFYPQRGTEKLKTLFLSQGELRDDFFNEANTKDAVHLVVRVNKDQFAASLSKQREWFVKSITGHSPYSSFASNCITFASEIVATLPIRAPKGKFKTPHGYIVELIKLNKT